MESRAVAWLALAAVCCTVPLSAQPLEASNPALSLLPKGTPVDWAYWNKTIAAQSRMRAAKRATSVQVMPVVREQEPADDRRWNDTQNSAEFIDFFGLDRSTAVVIRGVLYDSINTDLGTLVEMPSDDNGSIPLATNAEIKTGERLKVSAEIGDGPHGSSGSATADYDFYYIGLINAGQLLTAQIKTPASPTPRLDTKVGLYNASGNLLVYDDDGVEGDPDSFLETRPEETGEYWILVRGGNSDWPGDPFDPGSGPKAGSEGPYTLTLGLDAQDVDYYSFDLEAGNVLSASAEDEARSLALFDDDGTLRKATRVNWSALYPSQTPLSLGGNANIAIVAATPGRYAIGTTRGAGDYTIHLSVHRGPLALAMAQQVLFVDFDGALYDATNIRGNPNAQLASLREMLQAQQLEAEEDAVIDAAMATIHENLAADLSTARNPHFNIDLRNSRDHADVWGDPYVSRIIVGGTQQALGRRTIGISESIDVGNFALEETAIVLLDLLTNPDHEDSPSSVQYAAPLGIGDVIGRAIGTIVSHEAGHLFANFHTGPSDYGADLMNTGHDPIALMGIGADSVLGTADDVDVDYRESEYSRWERFAGLQDTRNAIAFGLYDATPTALEPRFSATRGPVLTAAWPNPASSRLHIALAGAQNSALRLTLYDVLGRQVHAKDHRLRAGEARLVVPVAHLSSGVYLLRAETPHGIAARKVVVAR